MDHSTAFAAPAQDARPRLRAYRTDLLRLLCVAATVVITLAISGWVFWMPFGPWSQALLVPQLLLCGLALCRPAAVGFGTALLVSLVAGISTVLGQGPFGLLPLSLELPLLSAYALGSVAIPRLIRARMATLRLDNWRWQKALESSNIAVSEWRRDRRGLTGMTRISPLWQQISGQAGTQGASPTDWLQAAHALDKDRAAAAVQALLWPGSADSCNESIRLLTPDGQWRWYDMRTHVQERNPQGQARRLLTTLSDATGQHTAEERQRMTVSLFQHLQEGVLITDMQHRVLDANPGYCRMMGQSRAALMGTLAQPIADTTLRRSGHDGESLRQRLLSGKDWEGRVQTERGDGSACVLQLSVSAIPEPDGPQRFLVITVSDLTQPLRQQAELERRSRFDPLTGLPNHDEFMRLLQDGIDVSEREGLRLCVCRVDLDQFKRINIEHGSAAADALLKQAAQRLEGALRSSAQWTDVVGRLGGDEFALLLRTHDTEEAQRALVRLLNVLRAPYQVNTQDRELLLEISASLGATLFPQDNSDAETLLRHAGHALYRVKHAGRNGFRFFDSAKRLRDEASLIELARVQQGLDNDELLLHYQPKIDMQSGRVLGMEALLRWQHPERGLLPPGEFLPLIEHTGLAVQVGDWVIEHALRQSAQWLEQGLTLNISVNVTARQLQMPDFSQRLQELINRHHRPVARYLSLEVLESAALADIAATHELILRCREFGVRFALDDFGTGYSTLTYLKKLPVDALKIDRSFVQNMLTDAQDMALVEGVIGLARHFGCEVIAEGVESAAHARALLRLSCQQGQGNGIAAAMPAAEVPGWVHNFARSPWLMQLGNPGSRAQGLA